MKQYLGTMFVVFYTLGMLMFSMSVFAQQPVAVPISGAVSQPAVVATPAPEATQDFLMQVLDVIKHIGGMKTMIAISAVLTLLVSSMKVSFLNNLIWSKLGALKPFVAPVIALVAGLLGLGAGGEPVTGALVMAYLFAGGGAVFLHEALDAAKSIPGLGPIYVSLIDFISGALKGPSQNV